MASSPTTADAPPRDASAPPATWRRWAWRTAIGAALVAILWGPAHVFLGKNIHALIPGKVYRGAQLDAAGLRSLVKQYGIRTIVNLRGTCYPQDWYVEEARTAQELDLALEDIGFSAGRWPSRHEVRRLVEVLDQAEYPLFLHCRHGADRTGMAGVVAVLLAGETPYVEARRHMSLRYGHAPIGRTTFLDRFFELYEAWLADSDREHSSETFRHWLLEEYRGGHCRSVIEAATSLQPHWRVGEPISYHVRVRNSSDAPWQFKPTRTAGMHLGFMLWDDAGKAVTTGRAGFMEKTVAPGEAVTVTVVVPPLKDAGRYHLLIDMIEEGHCWFYQTGSEPYEEELDVRAD
jgi:protein tyrosine phosphatase (PTP) superfamily phosphohydrolase (DUF442 family)